VGWRNRLRLIRRPDSQEHRAIKEVGAPNFEAIKERDERSATLLPHEPIGGLLRRVGILYSLSIKSERQRCSAMLAAVVGAVMEFGSLFWHGGGTESACSIVDVHRMHARRFWVSRRTHGNDP
jgi:hypothetical protein